MDEPESTEDAAERVRVTHSPTCPYRAIVYVLTALAAVVVVLTRLRLRRDARGAGRSEIARGPVAVHTIAGALALVTLDDVPRSPVTRSARTRSAWSASPRSCCWWIVVVAGLLILAALAARPRAPRLAGRGRSLVEGPGCPLLGHVGMLGGVVVFTYAYLVNAV